MIFRNLLTKQITHLNTGIRKTKENDSNTISNTFALILSLCERLMDLEFMDTFSRRNCLTPRVFLLNENYFSSALTKLKINVATFFDCLVLLDGRLHSLSTLVINVTDIFDPIQDFGRNVSTTIILFRRSNS